jgi:lipoic acid synthetase
VSSRGPLEPLRPTPIPPWIRVRVTEGENFKDVKQMVRSGRLHTVCEEARCPNIFDCWNRRTATFMILGDVCTRACRFCAVTSGRPSELDLGEPLRVAESVAELGLKHAVITSRGRFARYATAAQGRPSRS